MVNQNKIFSFNMKRQAKTSDVERTVISSLSSSNDTSANFKKLVPDILQREESVAPMPTPAGTAPNTLSPHSPFGWGTPQSLLTTNSNIMNTTLTNNAMAIGNRSIQGPVVQSIVSLTSSLRVISLTVLVDSIYNILIFFAEKM